MRYEVEPMKRHEFNFRMDTFIFGIMWDKYFKAIFFGFGPFSYTFKWDVK